MKQLDRPVEVLCCYAHEDQEFLGELKTHLSPLRRQNVIQVWHDGDISAGALWDQEIKKHLNEAQVILLLISPDFIDSDYCYSTEIQHALERHKRGEVKAIPILLRNISGWEKLPPGDIQLGQLQALPTAAKAVTTWTDRDAAWDDVVGGIERAINELLMRGSVLSVGRDQESAETLDIASQTTPREELLGATLYTLYRGHSEGVRSVTWSPDGKYIASGSDDGTVQVWEALTGRHLLTYRGHKARVCSVAWSPNGKYIASGSWDKTASISYREGLIPHRYGTLWLVINIVCTRDTISFGVTRVPSFGQCHGHPTTSILPREM